MLLRFLWIELIAIAATLIGSVAMLAQPSVDSGATVVFIQRSVARTQSENLSRGPAHPGSRDAGEEAPVEKIMTLRPMRIGADSTVWRFDVVSTAPAPTGIDRREWGREFITDRGGMIRPLIDTLSPIFYKSHAQSECIRPQGIVEYGGGMLELWRLMSPDNVASLSSVATSPDPKEGVKRVGNGTVRPRTDTLEVGDTWVEHRTALVRSAGAELEQEMAYTITYHYRGVRDTLGTKTRCFEWTIDAKTTRGITHFPDRTLDHYIAATAKGTSYFSPRTGILIASNSDEEVNVQTLYGMVDRTMRITTAISRSTMRPSVPVAPDPFAVEVQTGGIRQAAIGEYLPSFSFATIGDSSHRITNNELKGSYYLIDFWATWCKPCVEELAYLQYAYDRFKGKNFRILSLSLDMAPEMVTRFQREPSHAMPWSQALIREKMGDPIISAFNLSGIPAAVLIDPEGRILLLDSDDLHGSALERTLEHYIK